jgi:hypothetical protein
MVYAAVNGCDVNSSHPITGKGKDDTRCRTRVERNQLKMVCSDFHPENLIEFPPRIGPAKPESTGAINASGEKGLLRCFGKNLPVLPIQNGDSLIGAGINFAVPSASNIPH